MIKKANKGKIGGAHDKVSTPEDIAKIIIKWLPIKPSDYLIDAARGNGAFYNNFPKHNSKYYCEIDEGKDFFNWTISCHWIITNPPYSIFDAFLQHAFELSENVCFLCSLSKIVSSMGRIRQYAEYGGVPKILIISAGRCGFPFGFPCAAVWFKKNYKGSTKIELLEDK